MQKAGVIRHEEEAVARIEAIEAEYENGQYIDGSYIRGRTVGSPMNL